VIRPRVIRRFRRSERGATAIEYALVCGIIATSLIAIMATGGALDTLYTVKISNVIGALGGGGGGEDDGD
jgi:Flp pilus assembly pilin Flp